MNNAFIFLLMIFFHIVDDYYLQGILASMKQKKWWKENAPESLYKHDYIWALFMHSFSWAFMIMLPIAFKTNFNIDFFFIYIFILNVIGHAFIDDAKANKKELNLVQDQSLHLLQIVMTALVLLWF